MTERMFWVSLFCGKGNTRKVALAVQAPTPADAAIRFARLSFPGGQVFLPGREEPIRETEEGLCRCMSFGNDISGQRIHVRWAV